MPANKIYPKVIDISEYVVNTNVASGVPYIAIAYAVYENFNIDNGTWDSKMTYQYWFALNSFSYNYTLNNDTSENVNVSFSCNGVTLQFNLGDYNDPNGDVITINNFLGPVLTALGV